MTGIKKEHIRSVRHPVINKLADSKDHCASCCTQGAQSDSSLIQSTCLDSVHLPDHLKYGNLHLEVHPVTSLSGVLQLSSI